MLKSSTKVLILVFVEDGHWENNLFQNMGHVDVLILVFVEDGHWAGTELRGCLELQKS